MAYKVNGVPAVDHVRKVARLAVSRARAVDDERLADVVTPLVESVMALTLIVEHLEEDLAAVRVRRGRPVESVAG
jgi:hypothetical protein